MKNTSPFQIIQTLMIIGLTIAVLYLYLNPQRADYSNAVIHAKGISLADDQGNTRVVIGFPVTNEGRTRTDTLNGLVILDEKGTDRIHLGEHGKMYLGEKYVDRLNNGYSLFFNDQKGEERSGYGYSDDDNSVGLGMDYGGEHGGEAIYLYAAKNIAFMTINADLQNREGIRDRIVLWHETDKDFSKIKISDSGKDGRISATADGKAHFDYSDEDHLKVEGMKASITSEAEQ